MPSRLDLPSEVRPGADPSPEVVDRFVGSMPRRYGVLFGPGVVRHHAAIATGRGDKLAHVEAWRVLADGTTELCIVADDRPGLLVLIAGALASFRLDVMNAFIFSRDTDAGREAMDFFWVRRMAGTSPLDPGDVEAVAERLRALVAGTLHVEDLDLRLRAGRAGAACGADVRLAETNEDGSVALVIETEDAPALLFVIARTLFANHVEIVRSVVRTVGRRVLNRFDVAEFDGSPLPPGRCEALCAAVAGALT
jgi:UTP:GlnB (protein PII) uridylyltransferase